MLHLGDFRNCSWCVFLRGCVPRLWIEMHAKSVSRFKFTKSSCAKSSCAKSSCAKSRFENSRGCQYSRIYTDARGGEVPRILHN